RAGKRHKTASVGDKQILHVMRLAVAVQYALRRIGPHAGGAALVSRVAHRLHVLLVGNDFGVARPQDLLHPPVHVLHHFPIVLFLAGVKANLWNPVRVFPFRIELEVIVVIGDPLAVTAQGNRAAVLLTDLAFQFGAPTRHAAGTAHAASESAAHQQKVPAVIVLLSSIIEARNRDVGSARAVLVSARPILQLRYNTDHSARFRT